VRVVVATVVHHAEDARIYHRQIPALLEEGCSVVYVAPTSNAAALERPGLRVRPVPRAVGRRRFDALRVAWDVLREESETADLTVVHDPELTLLSRRIVGPALWDVHEDLPAQISDKAWIPKVLRGSARLVAGVIERRAASRFALTLAEPAYADRLGHHPVVRNTPVLPPGLVGSQVRPGDRDRIVYLGRISAGRGVADLMEVVERLDDREPHRRVAMDLVGPVDPEVAGLLRGSSARVHGFLPNPSALEVVVGARAGLSLLEDRPNYRNSTPTKVLEYLACGVPVITTPIAEARAVVERSGAGIVVPFGDPLAVVQAVDAIDDDEIWGEMSAAGRRFVGQHYAWADDAARMVKAYRAASGGEAVR